MSLILTAITVTLNTNQELVLRELDERAIFSYFDSQWGREGERGGRGARGVMVIVVGNGHGDTSSNPGRD